MKNHTIKRACTLLRRFDDYLQEESIDNWVADFNLSKKLLTSFLSGTEKPKISPSDELREYLISVCDIRQNEITGELFIKRNKRQQTKKELAYFLEQDRYEIKHLDTFLDSTNKTLTVVKQFNPFKDFFMQLADEYKGEKLISLLAACIPATNFNDKDDPDFYQNRLEYYLRKWLYKAAGQALGIGKNDTMLLWVAPDGGSGKSQLNQWLFSLPEFEDYYYRLFSIGLYSNMAQNASTKFALDFDELPLSKKKYQEFKSTVTADKIQFYDKKTQKTKTAQRHVNFLGSTNRANRKAIKGAMQPGFLLDDDAAMMRRIIPLDITGGINWQKYTKDIDVRQLWGEAATGILQAHKSGNKLMLTWDHDWNDLIEQNSRYINGNDYVDKNTVLKLFKPAESGAGVFITASEIIEFMNTKGVKHKLTPEKVGRLLKKHAYTEGRKGNNRGYWVNII